MQIVIDIPKIEWEWWQENGEIDACVVRDALRNGITLPKGHGRLIDADKIANEINTLKDNWNPYGNEYESGRYQSYDYAVDTIDYAPTIIEADGAEE